MTLARLRCKWKHEFDDAMGKAQSETRTLQEVHSRELIMKLDIFVISHPFCFRSGFSDIFDWLTNSNSNQTIHSSLKSFAVNIESTQQGRKHYFRRHDKEKLREIEKFSLRFLKREYNVDEWEDKSFNVRFPHCFLKQLMSWTTWRFLWIF